MLSSSHIPGGPSSARAPRLALAGALAVALTFTSLCGPVASATAVPPSPVGADRRGGGPSPSALVGGTAEPGESGRVAFSRVATTVYGDTTSQRAFTWYATGHGGRPVAEVSADRAFPAGAATAVFRATIHTNRGGERFFRAVATGLRPGTTYYYRLGFAGHADWSPIGSFVTSGGGRDVAFVAIADTRSGTTAEAQAAAAVIAKALRVVPDAAFVLHTGDIVEHGDRESDWSDFLEASQDSLRATTIVPGAGDLDAMGAGFSEHFTIQRPGGQGTSTGSYYSFDCDAVHVVVLDTNESVTQGLSGRQLEWLTSDVKGARARGAAWVVLSMHKGVYTPATHLDDPEVIAMRRVLVPLIDRLGIDLVLQGHDRVLSRTKVLASDPTGAAGARVVETTRFTEMVNGKRIEYAVDPHGTIFFLPNTAGSAHDSQKTSARGGLDLEAYFGLFDRLPDAAAVRTSFAAIRVTEGRLTVEQYDIRDGGPPRLFEGFGIDRRVARVDRSIAALPPASRIAASDAAAVAAVRRAVDRLTPDERRALPHRSVLEGIEHRLRILEGLASSDGRTVAWADPAAGTRQAVAVRNDTRAAFADVPVRVTLTNAPHVAARQLSFFTPEGAPVPFEVETWTPGSASTVWVKVPALPARSSAVVWAYFGGGAPDNDPAAVWSDGYSLVDHMNVGSDPGATRRDSTGRAAGRVRGAALTPATSERGVAETRFDGTRIEFPGNIGGDYDQISVSALYRRTAGDAGRSPSNAAVVAKERATNDGAAAFVLAAEPNDTVTVALAGNSFQFPNVEDRRSLPLVADGKPHLVTQTYDGMTYSVFIDGREAYSTMIEYRTTFSDPTVLTTIGDRDTNDGRPGVPFHGDIDEVVVAGRAFTPEYEAFRYANYFGDAVTPFERVSRSTEAARLPAPIAPAAGALAETPSAPGGTTGTAPGVRDREPIEGGVAAGRPIDLTSANVRVRVGRSTGRVPDDLRPDSGRESAELLPTTEGNNASPFQIFEVSLTPAQASEPEYHLTWRGSGGTRRVSAWVWDHARARWLLKASGFDARGAEVSLDVTALASEHAVANGTLRVLIWRGLAALPWAAGPDIVAAPEPADYEWGLDHVGDSQLYSQATPERFVDQMTHVAAVARQRKTALVVQAGDYVNREYYSQEYQWVSADAAMRVIEQARLPYLVSWGNHDYSDLRNGRVMLPRYFPMSRLEASLAGSPWRFGGSQGIDNYFYTGEIAGARLLVLSLGFFSANGAGTPGVAWAKRVIEAHPDHAVIVATHNSVNAGVNSWSNPVVLSELVAPYDNVKLVLGGHIAGTGIAVSVSASGRRAYGVLTDYQSRVYGGQEFLKHISVDAENGLVYFNTYSPMLDRTSSDGRWHQAVDEAAVPGFHGADTENFVIELDLGSKTTRTLATKGLTLAVGAALPVTRSR